MRPRHVQIQQDQVGIRVTGHHLGRGFHGIGLDDLGLGRQLAQRLGKGARNNGWSSATMNFWQKHGSPPVPDATGGAAACWTLVFYRMLPHGRGNAQAIRLNCRHFPSTSRKSRPMAGYDAEW